MNARKIAKTMACLVALLALAVVPGAAEGNRFGILENARVIPAWQTIPYTGAAVYEVNVSEIKYSGNHTINAIIYS
ncbi:MAG: hypothetical protein ACE5KT_09420, partial [Methanosarcinales archaeon]